MGWLIFHGSVFLFVHILSSVVLYGFHRYVFHGKLGSYPVLRYLRKLHTLHHKHSFTKKLDEFIKVPWWVWILLATITTIFYFVFSWSAALGVASFVAVYAIRHKMAHYSDSTSEFARHHRHHHVRAQTNFSGVYPVIDKWFSTYESSVPELRNKN